MRDINRALIPIVQRRVVVDVSRQIMITDKSLTRIRSHPSVFCIPQEGEKEPHCQNDPDFKTEQKAILANPNYANAWYNLGVAYLNSGQADKMMEVHFRLHSIYSVKAGTYFQ
jgi:hypothetical protein